MEKLKDGPAHPCKYTRLWQIGGEWLKKPKHILSSRIVKSLLVNELAVLVMRKESHQWVFLILKSEVQENDEIIPSEKWHQYRIR